MPLGTPVPLATMFCHVCSTTLGENNTSYGVSSVCEECYMELMTSCEHCGDYGWIEYSYDIVTRARRHNRQNAASTQEWIPTGIMVYAEVDGWYLCENCVHTCGECGQGYSTEWEAWECCDQDSQVAVHSYSFKPDPMFFDMRQTGRFRLGQASNWSYTAEPWTLYMGIELEVEKAYSLAQDFLEVAGESDQPYFVYLKSDGSLGDEGMEIVTMPATLESFKEMFPFKATDMLRDNGARAWNYPSCGMHVHVSRSAFTPSHLWKFIKWQTVNWEKCAEFAGRNSAQWASWNNSSMEVCQTQTSKAVKQRGYADWSNRYSAINLIPIQTVELRYFRPNLNKSGILRVVEFIQAIYDYTKVLTYRDIVARNYDFNNLKAFMEGKPEYENAYKYMLDNGI